MTDYIERAAAIKTITALSTFEKPEDINRAVEQERRKENEWLGGIRDALVEIGTMDAADVRPVVRGRWIVHDYGAGDMNYECSECKDISCCRADFCPDCGADMRTEFKGFVPLDNAKLEDADFSLADRIREENE